MIASPHIAIEAEGLNVHRDNKPVLRRLTFTMQTGSIVGLLGPSGCGKTTLMRSIVGIQKIHEGNLSVLGKPPTHPNNRKQIGYVSQSPAIYDDLSVWQNLRYFGRVMGANKVQIQQIIEELQLDGVAHRVASRLSGGQRARVSLGIALLGNPRLLVLDEPTVGLDPLLRRDLWKLFKSYTKRGVTLIISSHVMDEAAHCDEILLMREGRLVAVGTQQQILKQVKSQVQTIEQAFISIVEQDKEGGAV